MTDYDDDNEDTVCDCDWPRPDEIGECAFCKRLVLECSFASGARPVILDVHFP